MYFLIFTLIGAAVTFALCGVLRPGSRTATAIVVGLVIGSLGWSVMPTLAWGFMGGFILLIIIPAFIGTCMAAVRHLEYNQRGPQVWVPPTVFVIGLAAALLLGFITSAEMLHASSYRSLVGSVEEGSFSKDVAPIDVTKIRTVDQNMARRIAEKRLGQEPSLGSRVTVGTMNIQSINGTFYVKDGSGNIQKLTFNNEMVWAGPLEHSSFMRWWNNDTTEGYVLVSATDLNKSYLVTALCSQEGEASPTATSRMGTPSQPGGCRDLEMHYLLEGAYFSSNVRRLLYNNGYATRGLTDFSFEIDDNGNPHIVVTIYKREVGFSGETATGVVAADVQTGKLQEFTPENAPSWIDRIQPEAIIAKQIQYWGEYVNGYWNASAFGSKENVIVPTPGTLLVPGADGQTYWYTDMQSTGSDDGSVGYMLVNTRTKKARWYRLPRGGVTVTGALKALENAPGVKERDFFASSPILYNVGGVESYFSTLKGSDGMPKMYGFVDFETATVIGVADNPSEALRQYQLALSKSSAVNVSVDMVKSKTLTTRVKDVAQEADVYYLRLEDNGVSGVEFYGSSSEMKELRWTRPGDLVTIVYDESADSSRKEISIILRDFDNFDVPLTQHLKPVDARLKKAEK